MTEHDIRTAADDAIKAIRHVIEQNPEGYRHGQAELLAAAQRLDAVLHPSRRMEMPRIPTESMLNAARDWSKVFAGTPVGNQAATGCWQSMWDAFACDPKTHP